MKNKGLIWRVMTVLLLVAMLALPGAVGAREGVSKSASLAVALASVSVDDTLTPQALAEMLVGTEVTLSNTSFTGSAAGSGSFTGGTGIVGFEAGVILGSGAVTGVVGPNNSDNWSVSFSQPGDADLNTLIPGYTTYDATVLEFDFECPTGTAGGDVISFYYVFTSEEYNEYVNSPFNDVFGFFLNGVNIALLPDGVTPVSINNVNNGYSAGGGLPGTGPSNPAYYINNDLDDSGGSIDLQADGLTVVLGAQATINPGVPNHMKLAIADAGDGVLDSWVFLQAGSFVCAPLNQAPGLTVDTDPVVVDEGDVALNGGTVSDADGDTVTLTASVGTVTNNDDGTWSWSLQTLDGPDDSQTVTIHADDGNGGTDEVSFALTVNNVAPAIEAINGPADPVSINDQPVSVEVLFSDPGTPDTHDVTWAWGDGGSDTQTGATSPATASHTYADAGVFEVTVTVTDDDGGSASGVFQYIVVYDPSAGFVTGGGWIMSPAGAYAPDPALTGKATFGFVSKYKKGATVPTGQTEFQFHAAGMNFHSDTYQWLVVAGAKAQYKGVGTINGAGEYGFMLTAVDAALTPSTEVDLFRIKIWDKATGEIVYDNQMNADDTADPTTAIGGGNIVIHK
jgi:hypothetical protein